MGPACCVKNAKKEKGKGYCAYELNELNGPKSKLGCLLLGPYSARLELADWAGRAMAAQLLFFSSPFLLLLSFADSSGPHGGLGQVHAAGVAARLAARPFLQAVAMRGDGKVMQAVTQGSGLRGEKGKRAGLDCPCGGKG